MIFEKKLFFILPFYIFTFEKLLNIYERNKSKRLQLQYKFLELQNRLQDCCEKGLIDEYTRVTLTDMSKKVIRSLLGNKYPKVRKGVEEAMGGQILEYEAKTILNQGKREGRAEGRIEGESLLAKLISRLIDDDRNKDIEVAAKDEEARKQFYREYGLIE